MLQFYANILILLEFSSCRSGSKEVGGDGTNPVNSYIMRFRKIQYSTKVIYMVPSALLVIYVRHSYFVIAFYNIVNIAKLYIKRLSDFGSLTLVVIY